MSKICKIHNKQMTEYLGFNGRAGDPDNEWTCSACENLPTSEGIPDRAKDSGSALPIAWPPDWDFSCDVTGVFEDVAQSCVKSYGSFVVEYARRQNVKYAGLIATSLSDGTPVYVQLQYKKITPTQGEPADASQVASAKTPSSQPQHSTLTPLVTFVGPADEKLFSRRDLSSYVTGQRTLQPQDTDHLRGCSMPKILGFLAKEENPERYFESKDFFDFVFLPAVYTWQHGNTMLRNSLRSDMSNATSFQPLDQEIARAFGPLGNWMLPASEGKDK